MIAEKLTNRNEALNLVSHNATALVLHFDKRSKVI